MRRKIDLTLQTPGIVVVVVVYVVYGRSCVAIQKLRERERETVNFPVAYSYFFLCNKKTS